MMNVRNIIKRVLSILVLMSFILPDSIAQDGSTLFKQNCAACHKIDKASIGPKLLGAKSKWEEAGEGDFLYEWVIDPVGLYESGKSNLAAEVWDFNPSAMTPMAHLTNNEIDAIFAYVDTPVVEPVDPVAPSKTGDNASDVIETPSKPLTIEEKTIAIIIIVFLVAAISVMRGAKNALSDDYSEEEELSSTSTLSKVLVGAVDIEDEESILMDHDFDGIKELDNDLPPWWLWMFYATIIFSVIYVFIYHVMDSAPLQDEAYVIEMAKAEEEVEAYKLSSGMAIDENNVELITDETELAKGKVIFIENCVVCHNQYGEGASGPNLTDEYWVYGGDVKEVFASVKYGTKNGMPEHESKFNPLELQNVVSYVKSLPFKEGKEPEGEKE